MFIKQWDDMHTMLQKLEEKAAAIADKVEWTRWEEYCFYQWVLVFYRILSHPMMVDLGDFYRVRMLKERWADIVQSFEAFEQNGHKIRLTPLQVLQTMKACVERDIEAYAGRLEKEMAMLKKVSEGLTQWQSQLYDDPGNKKAKHHVDKALKTRQVLDDMKEFLKLRRGLE